MAINVTSGSFSPSSVNFTETYYGVSNGTNTKQTYSTYSGSSAVGHDTQEYHKKRKRGLLLPVTYWDQRYVSGEFTGSRQYGYYASNVLKTTYNQPSPNVNQWPGGKSIISVSECENQIEISALDSVVSNAVDKLLSGRHDTATFIAELGKTIAMFRGAIHTLANLLTSKDSVVNGYLQGRYGWRPLVYDLQNISDALAHIGKNSAFTREVTGFSTTYDLSSTETFTLSPVAGTLTNTCDKSVTVSYRGFATSKGPRSNFEFNPVVTAYELMKFSFILDWFWDLGSKLRYLCNLTLGGPEFVSGTGQYVHGTCESRTVVGTQSNPATGYRFHFNDATATSSVKLILRQTRTPSLIPYIRPRVSGLQVVDLLALLSQVVSKRK